MNTISICVGSSCSLKGSDEVIKLFQEKIKKEHLEDRITLKGAFCLNKCNREGVTITVNEEIYVGINPNNFEAFWKEDVLPNLK